MIEATVVRLVDRLQLVYAEESGTEKLYCFSLNELTRPAATTHQSAEVHIGTKVRLTTQESGKVLTVEIIGSSESPTMKERAVSVGR
jgi:hypothetical protein